MPSEDDESTDFTNAASPDAATLILGLVIGLGVCAPLLGGGRLFLLDWTVGPHDAIATLRP